MHKNTFLDWDLNLRLTNHESDASSPNIQQNLPIVLTDFNVI